MRNGTVAVRDRNADTVGECRLANPESRTIRVRYANPYRLNICGHFDILDSSGRVTRTVTVHGHHCGNRPDPRSAGSSARSSDAAAVK